MNRLFPFLLCLFASSAFAELQSLPGSSPQTALVRDLLAPVELRVLENGMPVAGAEVTFYAESVSLGYGGIGSADDSICSYADLSERCTVVTGADGVARFTAITSYFAGAYDVDFFARSADRTRDLGSLTLHFTFKARAEALRIVLLSGAEQTVTMGTIAPLPVRVRLESAAGKPLFDRQVAFEPRSGNTDRLGFDAAAPQVSTDASGIATSPRIFAGWGVGTFPLQVQVFDPDAGAFVNATVGITVVNEQGVPDLDLTNMWWSGPSQNGWGMSVVKHGSQLFNVLFVYDKVGQPTWYVQPGGHWNGGVGSRFVGEIYWPKSAPWFAYDASKLEVTPGMGSLYLEFRGSRSANLSGLIAYERLGGLAKLLDSRHIEPQDFTGTTASPITGLADMWWGGPSQNGWGIAILEQFGNLFSVWFTYGADGNPTWFVMPGGTWSDSSSYSGQIYKTVGTDWVFGIYDASKLQSSEVGKYTFKFLPDGRATFTYVLEGRSGTLALERQAF